LQEMYIRLTKQHNSLIKVFRRVKSLSCYESVIHIVIKLCKKWGTVLLEDAFTSHGFCHSWHISAVTSLTAAS